MTTEELLESNIRWLHFMANKLKPWYDANHDDIFQEGWIAMWQAIETYKPSKVPIEAWIYRKAKSRMIDFVFQDKPAFGSEGNRGRWKPKDNVSLDAILEAGDGARADILGDAIVSDESLVGVEQAYHEGDIMDALNRLSPKEREFVVLKFWGGLYTKPERATRDWVKVSQDLAPQFSHKATRSTYWSSAQDKLSEYLEHMREGYGD
jgi:RNA polymerase sigma factor (sigma-70 family)